MKGFIASQIQTIAVVVIIVIMILILTIFTVINVLPVIGISSIGSNYLINPVETSGKIGVIINVVENFEYNDKKFIDNVKDFLISGDFKNKEEFKTKMEELFDKFIASNSIGLYDIKVKKDNKIEFHATSIEKCDDCLGESIFFTDQSCAYGKGFYTTRKCKLIDDNFISVDEFDSDGLFCCSTDATVLSDIRKAKTIEIPLYYKDDVVFIEVTIG